MSSKSYKQRIWKNWLIPVNSTKWKNQWTFTGKQVKKTSKLGKFESCRESYEQRWSRNWEIFAGAEIKKRSIQDYERFKRMEEICEFLKESRAIENIPANKLDLILSKYFISVYIRKQNGTEYEPGTKTRLLQLNSMTQTRRRFLITPLERPVLDDFSKQ